MSFDLVAVDWLGRGWLLLLAFTVSVSLLALLRSPCRRLFGSESAFQLWLLPLLAMLVSQLPHLLAAESSHLPAVVFVITSATNTPPSAEGSDALFDWREAVIAIWLAGVVVSLLLAANSQWRYRSRMKGAVPVRGESGRWPVVHAKTPDIGPALVGAWRARIVLPSDFERRYASAEQVLILAHETAHARRGDGIWCLLSQAVAACFWFHPLAWWGVRALRHDQELACDAVVLRTHGNQRRVYANALLKTQSSLLSLPVGCAWSPRHPVTERIAMLKMRTPGRLRRIAGLAAVTTIVLGGSAMVYAAQQGRPTYAATPAAIAEAQVLLQSAEAAANSYVTRHEGVLPKDNRAAQLPAPEQLGGKFVRSVSLRDGVGIALLRDKTGAPAGSVLAVPHVEAKGTSVTWTCESPDLPDISSAAPECLYRPTNTTIHAGGNTLASTRTAMPADDEYQLDIMVELRSKGADADHAERTTVGLCMKPGEEGSVSTDKAWKLAATTVPKSHDQALVRLTLSTPQGAPLLKSRKTGMLGNSMHSESVSADGVHQYKVDVTPLAGCPARAEQAARLSMIKQTVKNQSVRDVAESMAQHAGLDLVNPKVLSTRLVTLNFDQVPAERAMELLATIDGKKAIFHGRQVRFDAK